MGLFGVLVNVVTLPLAVVSDAVETTGDIFEGNRVHPIKYTCEHLKDTLDELKEGC